MASIARRYSHWCHLRTHSCYDMCTMYLEMTFFELFKEVIELKFFSLFKLFLIFWQFHFCIEDYDLTYLMISRILRVKHALLFFEYTILSQFIFL